jgi:hypothetical protein
VFRVIVSQYNVLTYRNGLCYDISSIIPTRFVAVVAVVAVVALGYPLHQREKCVRDGSSSRIGRVRMH